MQVLWNQSCDKLNRKSVPISENELVDSVSYTHLTLPTKA